MAKESAADLYIEVTPCNGRVTMFVSDDSMSLFTTDKKTTGFLNFVSQLNFGKLISVIPDVAKF